MYVMLVKSTNLKLFRNKFLENTEEKASLLISKGGKCEITRRYTREYYCIDLHSNKTLKTQDIHKR